MSGAYTGGHEGFVYTYTPPCPQSTKKKCPLCKEKDPSDVSGQNEELNPFMKCDMGSTQEIEEGNMEVNLSIVSELMFLRQVFSVEADMFCGEWIREEMNSDTSWDILSSTSVLSKLK